MSRIVIQNTTILTLDDDDSFYFPGVIEIRDDKIFSIGEFSRDKSLEPFAGETTVIDGTDKLVMPGLVDLHFHTSVAKVWGKINRILRMNRLTLCRGTTMSYHCGSILTQYGTQPFEL